MKTSERHHLKENDLALALARAQAWTAANARLVVLAIAAVAVLVIGVAGYLAWQASVENQARASLASAMVTYESRVMPPPPATSPDEPTITGQMPGTFPSERARLEAALPQFLETADRYAGTNSGRTARFHAAAVLVGLGRYDEAIAHYDQLLDGRDVMAHTARLGKAEAQVQAREYDAAIATYKAMVEAPDARIPVEGVLMELARAYRLSGNLDEARTTLNTIVEQHGDSPFAPGARAELEKIKPS
jgi:tetratricopeptide (TPR) repeat protein